MLQYLQAARAFLAAMNPDLPAAVFVALVFLVVLGIRKVFPTAWEKWASVVPVLAIDPSPVLVLLSKLWQAVPAAVIGAVLAALQSGADVKATVYGALLALVAPVAHELAKNYKGTLGASKPRVPPVLPVLYLFGLAAFVSVQPWLTGCDPRKPPCDETKLRAVDARHLARVTALCLRKYAKASDCPEYPALLADHRRELREVCPQ